MNLQIINAKTFLTGQLELYKIEFVETNDNNYLEVMNSFNNALNTVKYLEDRVNELVKEKRELAE